MAFYNDPIRVEVPGHGMIEFPPGTPPQVIRAAIERLTGGPDTGAPRPAATGALQAQQDAMDPVLRDQKRQELETIRSQGDLGFTDTSDEMRTSRFNMMPGVGEQSKSQRYLRETVLDRGFGWAVGGVERAGLVPEGTRAAMRENQQEAADDYLLAHPEGDVGRAITLSAGDVAASMAGPQALLGPGTGALTGRLALGAGASPAAARLAGFAGGAAEGAVQGYLDSPDLSPEERWKSVALGAGLGGLGSVRSIRLPEDDLISASRRAPASPDVTQPRPRPQLSEAELAMYQQERAAVPEIVAQQVAAREGRPGRAPLTPEDIQAYQGALERQVDQKWARRLAELAAQEDSPAVRIAADDLAVTLAPEVKAPPRRYPVKEVQAFGETWQIDLNPAEAGFIRTGGGKITTPGSSPPPRPSDSVIAHDITETAAPFRERLREFYDRFVEQFSDKEVGPGRMLRRQGLGAEGEKIDKLISHNRAAVAAADLPLFQGVESFDPVSGNTTRVYDPLSAIIGGMDEPSVRDLNDLMAAEHHMELVARQERAALEYDMARARRLEEMRQARQADRQSLRAMSGEIRDQMAQRIRAERAEAKATGRYDAYLKSEGRAAGAGSRRRLLTPMEQSTDAAAAALGRGQQGLAAAPDPRRAVASAQRVAMGIRDDATSWSRRFPRVERPADLDLNIDPAGTAAAQAILQDLNGRYGADPAGRVAQLADIADRVREWSYHAVVRPLRETGFLSQAQEQALMSKNERYAPFFRIMDEVDADGSLEVLSGSTNAKPIRRISGGLSPERPIAPPLESFIQQAQKVTVWARRQQIRNMLGDLAEVHPDTVGAEVRRIRGTGGADSFPVYRDGVATHYQAPADVMLALQRLTPKQASIVTEAAQAAARLLRAGATLSPEFAARNLWRDQWSAAVYGSKYGYVPFVDAVHGLFEVFRKGDAYRGYLSGGAMSDMVSYQRQAIQRTLADVRGQGGGWGRFRREWGAETNRVAKVLFPVLYPLEAVSKTIEMSTRVGAYRKAKLRGASDLDAAVYSRDITLDFGRSGTFGQRWNGVEAFANASLQDVARFRQAMQNPKTAFSTSVKALAWITIPAALNYYANRPDDEVAEQYKLAQQALDAGIEDQLPEDQRVGALLQAHPELRYQDLPEWEKRAFYHVGWKEDGRPWRIPRPLGLLNLFFGYGVERTLDAIMQTDPDAGKDIRNAVVQETPLRFLNPLEAAPTIMQPGVEAVANYSAFKQGPIVPPSAEKLLPEDQYTDQTSGIARWAGRQTGTSPLKIDYLIRGYLGTLGGQAAALTPGGANLPPLPTQAQDVPLVKGFVGTSSIGFGSQPVSDIYTVARVAEQANESYEKALDNNDAVNAARIMREHPELMVLDPLREGLKDLRELRKMREEVRHDASLTPQARLEALMQIDQLATQISGARMIGVAEELSAQGLKLPRP